MNKTNKTTKNQPNQKRCKRSSAGDYCVSPVPMKKFQEKRLKLYENLIKKKENILKRAINSQIGENWNLEDIKDKCEMKYNEKGTLKFCFDGKELIEFFPEKMWFNESEETITVELTQKYRLLYTQ